MESLGQKLKDAREQHNYSLEQVTRDTHISKQYLKALEEEDFAAIPGETYLVGFLRNYAEYLSLNPEELVNLYKNMKIQEQPLPMNELLERNSRKSPSFIVFLMVIIILVLGGGGFLLYRFVLSPSEPGETASPEQSLISKSGRGEYTMKEEVLTRWFNLEDSIIIPMNGKRYPVNLIDIEDKLTLKIPGGTLELNIGQERLLDLNTDTRNDIRLLLNDLDLTGAVKRANIGFYKLYRSAPSGSIAEASEWLEEAPEAGPASRLEPEPGITIISSKSSSPFRVSISFRGYCLFRYLLNGETREERFLNKS